jgi:hypothetical protein
VAQVRLSAVLAAPAAAVDFRLSCRPPAFFQQGRKKRVNEIPELKMAIISLLFASLEVNQMIDKNRKIGNNKLAK